MYKYTQCALNLQTSGIVKEIPVWKETSQVIEGKASVVACTKFEESILQHHARAQIYDVLRAVQDQICGENQTNNARRENQVPETSQLQLVPLGLGEHHD